MLVLNHPRAIDLLQAECCPHYVFKGFPIWQRATAADEAMGEGDIVTGCDGEIFEMEHSFSLGVWLPLVPTEPVCFRTFMHQRRQDIEDHQICCVVPQNVVLFV